MAHTRPIELDPAQYVVLPHLPSHALLTLACVLLAIRPRDSWPAIEGSAARVELSAKQVQDAIALRLSAGSYTRSDISFDAYVDTLWGQTRDGLLDCIARAGPGHERLAEGEVPVDVEHLRERALEAQSILDKLFPTGLDFTETRYPEQAELTRERLEVIAREGLSHRISELVDPDIIPLLRAAQVRYEHMVDVRRSQPDLPSLCAELRSDLGFYAMAVLAMVNAPEALSVAAVEAALAPILQFRASAREATRAAIEAGDLLDDATVDLIERQLADPSSSTSSAGLGQPPADRAVTEMGPKLGE